MSLPLVVKEFSKLGFVAFGGPPAHVALMLKRFAEPGSLEWISGDSFAGPARRTSSAILPPSALRLAHHHATTSAPPSTAQASLFALTQCLPGPSSTQLATALGGLQASDDAQTSDL